MLPGFPPVGPRVLQAWHCCLVPHSGDGRYSTPGLCFASDSDYVCSPQECADAASPALSLAEVRTNSDSDLAAEFASAIRR